MPWRKGTRLRLVGEYETDGHTQEIYQEVRQALGVPQVNALFQAFALYPKFLDLFWRTMRPALEAGLADEEITAVARISELFVEGLSRRVVNVTLAKICLEGGNSRLQAPASPVQGEPKQAA